MGYSLDKSFVSCWTCGGHNLLRTLEELTGERKEVLKDLLGGLDKDYFRVEKPRGKLIIPKGVGPLLKPHRAYLKWRGFDPDEIAEIWGVKGVGIAPRLSWHLWIPVYYEDRIISWTARSISREEGGRRYTNAKTSEEEMPMKSVLYGGDLARTACVVVEGCTDAWAIGPGAVATMGINVTQEQIYALQKFTRVGICFDSEQSAQVRAKKLARQMEFTSELTEVFILETGKDAGSAKKEEIRELRESVFS